MTANASSNILIPPIQKATAYAMALLITIVVMIAQSLINKFLK